MLNFTQTVFRFSLTFPIMLGASKPMHIHYTETVQNYLELPNKVYKIMFEKDILHESIINVSILFFCHRPL